MKNQSQKKSKGFFITCEGGEGSGKSTLLLLLEKELTARSFEVVSTREPGGSLLGNEVRKLLLDKKDNLHIFPKAELLLFLAARSQHIEELILPALQAGKIVLCDRFNDSTIAYQGYARGLGVEEVEEACQFVSKKCQPDLTFFLDLDPLKGLNRRKQVKKEDSSEELDRIEMEKLEFHEKVRQGLILIANKEQNRMVTIDASQSKEAVFAHAWKCLEKKLFLSEK